MKTIDVEQDSLDQALRHVSSTNIMVGMKLIGVATFDTKDVLNWRLDPSGQTLREQLVDAAGRQVSIQDEYRHTWFGEVERRLDKYVVTIWSGIRSVEEE